MYMYIYIHIHTYIYIYIYIYLRAHARECMPEYTTRVRPKCRQGNPIECPTEYPLLPLGTHVCR